MTRSDDEIGTRALGDAIAGLLQVPARLAGALAGALETSGSQTCDIPPPCWEPRPAGTCSLALPPGCTGTIRVRVANCDWSPHVVGITALGHLAGWVKFEPTTLVVNLQEQATIVVTVRVPDGMKPGQTVSGPLLVRGCLDHVVRVRVTVAECAGRTCCDVTIEDCPDHVHHWYDHFYCPRPCRQLKAREANDG